MRHFFARLVISNSLSTGRPLSRFWRSRILNSPALQEHERRARQLHQALAKPRPDSSPEVAASVQARIMRAIRASSEQDFRLEPGGFAVGWKHSGSWAMAVGAALVLLGGAWLVVFRPFLGSRPGPALPETVHNGIGAALPSVIPVVEHLATNGLALLSQPMNRQIEDLSQDVRETARFLLASLP
jgi:hypothetical protein